ncbi:hypothetical protein [Paenibacillus sp.]|uniref:hypothetical protein n=1 Tax=Paenibacillus sp. TaxID=58172 RepID=UPI002811F8EE|nr:hypothetical protein [Paenibacillus sp.]
MTPRATTRWIRTFVNAHKLSSFQDKTAALRAEPNPYYLLEWLVVPKETEAGTEDDAFWSAWEGERTPGAEKGSLIGVEACFREQLPIELLIGEPIAEEDAARLATAFADLAARYGVERWSAGVEALVERLRQAADRSYPEYVEALRLEAEKLDGEAARQLEELKAEAAEYEEGEFDLEAEKRAAQSKWDRKKQELPLKLLSRLFPDDALLRGMATSGVPKPAERVKAAAERLRASASHPAIGWAAALDAGDVDALERDLAAAGAAAAAWLAAYMSRSEMTRGWLPLEERQRAALRWIARTAGAETDADEERGDRWMNAAFRAAGWEGLLAEPEFAERALHAFVWRAARAEDRRKRLREELVLQHWASFADRFREDGAEERFETVSWVFLLDPENVQQRLLRGAADRAEELIRRLCLLYAEGIRRGLDVRIVVSLYTYLAKHDREVFYSFVHGTKSIEEALPMMELPSAELSQLFRGDGVRQTSARKHLLQLFYAFLEEPQEERQPKGKARKPSEALQKLAAILSADKRAAVVGWLHRHERDWRSWVGDKRERGEALTRLLRFRWLGTAAEPTEQHRAVEEWLQRRTDWVQFETDAPNVEGKGVTYAIAKPGAIDAETGEVLVRATVRAEWSDRKEIGKLLDDLKLL